MKLKNLLGYEPPDFVAHPAMNSGGAATFPFCYLLSPSRIVMFRFFEPD
jgi:hypothetical protein